METLLTNRFFEGIEIPECTCSYKKYAEVKLLLRTWEMLSPLHETESHIIVDFSKKNFFWVSAGSLFLNGHTPRYVEDAGYEYFREAVHPDDLPRLMRIHKIVHDFPKLPVNIREFDYFEFEFRLMYHGKELEVRQTVRPIMLTKREEFWLVFCTITLSGKMRPDYLAAHFKHQSLQLNYNFTSNTWEKVVTKELTECEKLFLLTAGSGCSNKELAARLYIAKQTVKNRKCSIFQKLGTSNITESLQVAISKRLL